MNVTAREKITKLFGLLPREQIEALVAQTEELLAQGHALEELEVCEEYRRRYVRVAQPSTKPPAAIVEDQPEVIEDSKPVKRGPGRPPKARPESLPEDTVASAQ